MHAKQRKCFRIGSGATGRIGKVHKGWTQAAVAAFLDVPPVTVAKWMARHRQDGDAGWAAKPTPARPRFLTPGSGASGAQVAGGEAYHTRFPHGPPDGSPGGPVDPPAVARAVPPGLPAGLAAAAGLESAEVAPPGEAEAATGLFATPRPPSPNSDHCNPVGLVLVRPGPPSSRPGTASGHNSGQNPATDFY